jgi:hypothetical protein
LKRYVFWDHKSIFSGNCVEMGIYCEIWETGDLPCGGRAKSDEIIGRCTNTDLEVRVIDFGARTCLREELGH